MLRNFKIRYSFILICKTIWSKEPGNVEIINNFTLFLLTSIAKLYSFDRPTVYKLGFARLLAWDLFVE